MNRFWRTTTAALAAVALASFLGPRHAGAQTPERVVGGDVNVISAGGAGEDLVVDDQRSLFDIQAFGDEGSAGVRSNGQNAWCVQNITAFASRFQFGCAQGMYTRTVTGGFGVPWFDTGMMWGAPASDFPEAANEEAVIGGGYTFNMTTLIIGGAVSGGGDKLWASDRSASELLALGVTVTEDASCTNHTSIRDGNMDAGFQLTPTSDCPPTHPPTGWQGRHPIEADAYLELQATHPDFAPSVDNDPFAFWRVPEELQRTDKFFGDWQTYGELNDFWLQALGRYASVVPGGSGDPEYGGWPLGLTMFYDDFYFGLPSVGGANFLQSTIVNNSERVYGVGVEYDSVYIGINYDPLTTGPHGSPQADAHYFDPDRNLVAFYDPPGTNCDPALQPPGSGCGSWGFAAGAPPSGFVVLKSPIGDMRYELFSDPTSDFFDPGHPRAGDTITIQHNRQCGFGGCIPNTWSRSQRAAFGWMSSTGENVLDGRAIGDLEDRAYHRIFRPEDWPAKNGQFNKYVPGVDDSKPVWDWNHDGVPDTIYADACGSRGCVALWGDTLPSGWANGYGNISGLAVGPVHMAPGDTVGWVVAVVGAADSAGIEATINNAIDFYKGFYLGPEAAPAPAITAVDVVPGGVRQNSITLYLDDTSEEWVDPFLQRLDVSADVGLNPFLDDSIQARITDNVAAIHIFKSCDGGNTFTTDGDCDGDPVNDATSKWAGFGWSPYQTFEASSDGTFPNVFQDFSIVPGVTYTYSIVTETRGAEFNLVRGSPGNFNAELVQFAPSLLAPLSASATNPNVAVVYAPVNLAAGATRAELTSVSQSGNFTVPVDVGVIGTAPEGGDFQTVFADSLLVTQVETLEGGAVTGTQTSVSGFATVTVTDANGDDARAVVESFEFDRSGTVSIQGLSEVDFEETETQRTRVFAGHTFGLILIEDPNGAQTPLMVSTTLDGDETTPGTFFGRADFPFFVVNVDASLGGDFQQQLVTNELGDTVAGNVIPSVRWRTGTNQSAALDASEFGTLVLSWAQDAFGPGTPFRINDRANVVSNFLESLQSRVTASTSSTDPTVIEAVNEAAGLALDPAEVQAFDLPFSVRNRTFGRDVEVVVTSHQDDILIGQGVDSIRVDVPEGLWVPGDVTYLVETVTRNVTDDNGNVVLGANGQPQTETVPAGTFRAVLGCIAPRNSCDPTIGGVATSGYVRFQADFEQHVEYLVPIEAGDRYSFTLQPAISAEAAAAAGDVSLDGVHVVPNPYLFANKFERATDQRVLRFTNVPPEGRIRIYDVAGRFIQEINWVPEDLNAGDLDWNLQTRENLQLAAGLYVFVLETPDGDRTMGKFVVIR